MMTKSTVSETARMRFRLLTWSQGLTRIRPNYWAFKAALFGSNTVVNERRRWRAGEHFPKCYSPGVAKAIGMNGIAAETAASPAKNVRSQSLLLAALPLLHRSFVFAQNSIAINADLEFHGRSAIDPPAFICPQGNRQRNPRITPGVGCAPSVRKINLKSKRPRLPVRGFRLRRFAHNSRVFLA
jgi:hypothetical protein